MSVRVTFDEELSDEAIELLAAMMLDEAERLHADDQATAATKGGAA